MSIDSPTAAIQAIRSTAERMQKDSRFKVVFEEFPALADDDIDAWQEWLVEQPGMEGYVIPAELRAVYGACGGFRWRWQFLASAEPTTGSAELVDLMSLYHRDDEDQVPVTAIYQAPRAFDIIDQNELVAIRFRRDSDTLSLLRIDHSASTESALSLRPTEYLQFIATFAARYDWQRLFEAGKVAPAKDIEALRREVSTLLPE